MPWRLAWRWLLCGMTPYTYINIVSAEWWVLAADTQVLVATSTLAWGVNTPAHLVIIKGTEFFDAPTRQASAKLLVHVLDTALQVPASAL